MAVYKIKDLENLTGIKAHTIRIWEKRYSILKPARSTTKIRQYDDRELTILLNISLLNKHGVKISHISEMSENEISNRIKIQENMDFISCFHESLLIALIELDEKLFKNTLQGLIDEVGLELAFTKHIIPFLEKIGIMWMLGTINPAQEHFISNLIKQKLIVEIDKIDVQENLPKVLLFLPEHELHEIGLLFYTFMFKKNQFKTYYLGQKLPYDSLLSAIEKINPELICTSWISRVDTNFVTSYFERLKKDLSLLKQNSAILAGGNLIKENINELKKYLKLIDSAEDINFQKS